MTYQSLESTIEILAAGRQEFLTRRAEDVIGQGKGKEDTLRFDNFFEDLLIRGIGRGEAVVLVSEECGKYVPSGNTVPPFADNSLTLIVDPVDMTRWMRCSSTNQGLSRQYLINSQDPT